MIQHVTRLCGNALMCYKWAENWYKSNKFINESSL